MIEAHDTRFFRFRHDTLAAAEERSHIGVSTSHFQPRPSAYGRAGTSRMARHESVAAEALVFIAVGPWLLHRIGPSTAMAIAAVAGAVRWCVFVTTSDVAAMVLVEPLHGLNFALLHLACMRVIGELVPQEFTASAGDLREGGDRDGDPLLTWASGASGGLYKFGAAGLWAMALLSISAMPFIVALRRASVSDALNGLVLGCHVCRKHKVGQVTCKVARKPSDCLWLVARFCRLSHLSHQLGEGGP